MSSPYPSARPPEPRIGDAEREGAAWALGEHFAAGRLSQDEYDERAGVAWQARTHSELAPLFRDLPLPHGRAVTPPPWGVPQPAAVPARRPQPRRSGRVRGGRRGVPWVPLLLLLIVLSVLTDLPVLLVLLIAALVFTKLLPGCRH